MEMWLEEDFSAVTLRSPSLVCECKIIDLDIIFLGLGIHKDLWKDLSKFTQQFLFDSGLVDVAIQKGHRY